MLSDTVYNFCLKFEPYWTNLIFVPSGLNLAKFTKMLKNAQKLLVGCKFISIILLVFILNCRLGIGKKVFKWRNYLSQENIQGSKLYLLHFVYFPGRSTVAHRDRQ